MNGLFSGLLGGGNKPMNTMPPQPMFRNPLSGTMSFMQNTGGMAGVPSMGNGFGAGLIPGLSNKLKGVLPTGTFNVVDGLAKNAQSPMSQFGMGMMNGGWLGGMGPGMNAMRQQQMNEWLKRMQGGGLGGGGLMGGPAPASIY